MIRINLLPERADPAARVWGWWDSFLVEPGERYISRFDSRTDWTKTPVEYCAKIVIEITRKDWNK